MKRSLHLKLEGKINKEGPILSTLQDQQSQQPEIDYRIYSEKSVIFIRV